jgi:prepilin-type N-terminal cleavage/methylation domain-containing protein
LRNRLNPDYSVLEDAKMKKQSGFTLIEIAIVLVIIGLLLGGVLKGQELIQSARTRNLISTDDGIRAAFFGFQDRFRAYPGDYLQATTNITGVANNGNGNGQITASGVAGAPNDEYISVWDHLSKAGFINGNYTYSAGPPATGNSPANPYAGFLVLIFDNVYDPAAGAARHNLKTGTQIPANILAEVDRKIDDGIANTGAFRFSDHTGFTGAGAVPVAASCYTTVAGPTFGAWIIIGANVQTNCGGANLF